jgi:nitrate reductase NapE component
MNYNSAFNKCVEILDKSAVAINKMFPSTKMDYTKINVLVFCIIWPVITVGLIATIATMVINPDIAVLMAKLAGLQ